MAKPVSGTAVDTTNALSIGITTVWGFLEGSGNSIDSKGTNNLALSGGTWSTDGAGDACYAVATAAATPCLLTTAISITGTASWSIAWRAQKDSDANANGMICGNNDSNQFIWHLSGTALRMRVNGGDVDFNGTSFTAMDDYGLAFNPGGSHQLHCYRNGVETSGSPTIGFVNAELHLNSLMAGFNGSASFGFEGKLSYFYIWDGRELTAADYLTLHATPYVIFQGGTTTATGPFRARNLRPAIFKPGQRRAA